MLHFLLKKAAVHKTTNVTKKQIAATETPCLPALCTTPSGKVKFTLEQAMKAQGGE
jgi:hypothetical protein